MIQPGFDPTLREASLANENNNLRLAVKAEQDLVDDLRAKLKIACEYLMDIESWNRSTDTPRMSEHDHAKEALERINAASSGIECSRNHDNPESLDEANRKAGSRTKV